MPSKPPKPLDAFAWMGDVSSARRRIFLAHGLEDKPQIRKLYTDLKERGLDPWLDEIDLMPGQIWKEEIPRTIRQAKIFLACLSTRSVKKVGYVQNEFRLALSALGERPPGSIFFIPARLDDCEVPDLQIPDRGLSLRDIHWVDLWQEGGFDRLVSAIDNAAEEATLDLSQEGGFGPLVSVIDNAIEAVLLPKASREKAATAILPPKQVVERRFEEETHDRAQPAKAL